MTNNRISALEFSLGFCWTNCWLHARRSHTFVSVEMEKTSTHALICSKVCASDRPENSIQDVPGHIVTCLKRPVSIRSSLVGSHEPNGFIERYLRTLREQIRAIRLRSESRIGLGLSSNSQTMSWVVRHASWLLPRFQTWYDQTPYMREQGLRELPSRVSFLLGRERKAGWYDAHWLGRDDSFKEHLLLEKSTGEVSMVRSVKRQFSSLGLVSVENACDFVEHEGIWVQ